MLHRSVSPRSRTVAAVLVVFTIAAALWYVTAPPKGIDGYRERASYTAGSIRAQIQSTRIVAETFTDGELPHAATLVGFEEAERDAKAASATFEEFEPPTGTHDLRTAFVSISGDASDALSALRIAGQQEQWDRIAELAEPLAGIAVRLERFIERAEP